MPLETDQSNGFKLNLQQEVRTGIYRNLFSRSVPLWGEGENVLFTDYGASKITGWGQVATTGNSEPIRGLHQNIESGEQVAYLGDLTALYRFDGSLTTVGTGYSLAEDAGGSVWDSGSSTWDSGSTIFDDGVVRPGHWSIINYGNFILATNGFDNPLIKKASGGNFVSLFGGVTGIFVSSGGTGYAVDDALTITGGDGSGATAVVTEVSSGVITGVAMTNAGTGFTTVPTGVTGGSGSGATFTFTISDLDVSTVEVFLARGPHILGFNTSNSGREFVFSDADDPDTWVSASDNLAGALEIRELKSDIIAAVPLGSRIAVYGEDQMFLVSYLANDLVFGYQPALNGVGAVSKKAVVAVGPRNFGLSSQGFFVTDGASFQYIDDPIRKWFQANSNAQIGKAMAFHDEENNCVRWYFPTTSVQITEGVIYNYEYNVWSFVTSDKSAGQERIVFSYPLTGDEQGNLFYEGEGQNDNASAITSFLRSKPMDLNNADRVKELDSIRIGFTGMGLQYRIGWSETENGTITWTDYTEMEEGFDFDSLRTAGRWLHMELYSNTLNADWEVVGMEVQGRIEGTR